VSTFVKHRICWFHLYGQFLSPFGDFQLVKLLCEGVSDYSLSSRNNQVAKKSPETTEHTSHTRTESYPLLARELCHTFPDYCAKICCIPKNSRKFQIFSKQHFIYKTKFSYQKIGIRISFLLGLFGN
jgi:hypothetical protein